MPRLQFNFNPLALENQRSPALTALFRLGKEVPLNTAKVLVQPDAAATVATSFATLPEVAATWNLENFIPVDQDKKLPAIEAAQKALGPILARPAGAAPSDAENVAALKQGAQALKEAADSAMVLAPTRRGGWPMRSINSRKRILRNASKPPKLSFVRCSSI